MRCHRAPQPSAGAMLTSSAAAIPKFLLKQLDHVLGMGGQPQLCIPGWGRSTLEVPKHNCCISSSYIRTQMYQTDSNSRDKGNQWWALGGGLSVALAVDNDVQCSQQSSPFT